MNDEQIKEISHLSEEIRLLQPKLSKIKSYEYAIGILEACLRYKVDPQLLVAITHQESSFRENLPLGGAGEWGMTQIRKAWLKNRIFRTEFPYATEASLKRPETSFLYSAWLLNHLKKTEDSDRLPYWTYYNARSYSPRYRYFQHVYKKLRKVRIARANAIKDTPVGNARRLASRRSAPTKLSTVAKAKRVAIRNGKRYQSPAIKKRLTRTVASATRSVPKNAKIKKVAQAAYKRGYERKMAQASLKLVQEKDERFERKTKQRQALASLRKVAAQKVAAQKAEQKTNVKLASVQTNLMQTQANSNERQAETLTVRRRTVADNTFIDSASEAQTLRPKAEAASSKGGWIASAVQDLNKEYRNKQRRLRERGELPAATVRPANLVYTGSVGPSSAFPSLDRVSNELSY